MRDERNREYFNETFSEIHAPSALVGKVLDMTENNERKARPVIIKKVVIIAAVVVLVAVTTLAIVATFKVDYTRDITFGNKRDETFFESATSRLDGEDAILAGDDGDGVVSAYMLKEEFMQYLTPIKKGELIFDIPAIVDEENIAIPEEYELSHMDSRTLEEQEYTYTSTVNYYYNNGREEIIIDGNNVFLTKHMSVHIVEIFENSELVIVHDGEMFHEQAGDGKIDIYYYHEKPTYGIVTHYMIIGEKYKVEIYSHVSSGEDDIYYEYGMLTIDEVKAIAESIDQMFYPD